MRPLSTPPIPHHTYAYTRLIDVRWAIGASALSLLLGASMTFASQGTASPQPRAAQVAAAAPLATSNVRTGKTLAPAPAHAEVRAGKTLATAPASAGKVRVGKTLALSRSAAAATPE